MSKITTITPAGILYLVELAEPFERLEFQFVPGEINIQSQATNNTIVIPGRNHPVYHYTGGTDKLSFKLVFFADDSSMSNVIARCNWLRSLRINDGYRAPKRRVKLVWGDLFKNDKWIVETVNIKYSDFHSDFRYSPIKAEVDLSLNLDPDKNILLSDWR